jgi:internalin A
MASDEVLISIKIAADSNSNELHLSNENLTEIPREVFQLQNLTLLDLSFNQIVKIPAAIAKLQNLRTLYLHHNQIVKISDAISQLQNLKELYLSGNQIVKIPDFISQLQNLTSLDFSYNQIVEIPNVIAKLQNLTELYLFGNQIVKISDAIAQLQNLIVLNLSDNQIVEIPDAIAKLRNLTELYLFGNQIVEIPDVIAQLKNLIVLNLSYNQIVEIPDSIAKLRNLTELYLFGNQIVEIPDAIAQLKNLTELYFFGNQIVEISDAIAKLKNLIVLNLSSNQIVAIPDAIAKLQNLIELNLSGNQIVAIPDAIAKLQNLIVLNLSYNQIVEIPDTIAKLQSLELLYLYNNKIVKISDAIEKLTKLQKLDLQENPLPIPLEVIETKKPQEILNYLRQLHQKQGRPLHEAKILLIGQGSVGKTSLKKQLIHNQFDKNESQTHGLEVEYWPIKINESKIRLNFWDFGGQEIYHATHQFFLTKRSLYLLVCDCRNSEEQNRLEYWLKLIETFGDQSPVIIVGNKKDEQPFDINRKALLEKYPNIKAILETSCLNGQGVDELRNVITREIEQLKEVYDPLPLPWFEVKEQLEAMTEDFISDRKYTGICIENNITEDENQDQLIDLLHRLGVVLCFRNHALLQSTNVLKPDWVTTGIYALLSDDTLKTQKKGIFGVSELIRILDNQRYPEKRHHFLIELMKEFQLCFKLNESEQYLIPGLLPKEEPKNTDLGQNCLKFQYHYRILPESIISRFIVLNHEKIYKQTYWRSGVILFLQEFSNIYNIACIKADFEDKKIFITISETEQTRRLFLAIIRDTFQKIHHTFANLEVSEWVPVPGYPNHPPLDYQELIGLEAMGKTEFSIGKLRIDVDIRQLLDGYETFENRKIQGDYIANQTIYNQYGQGDNVGQDKVGQDKIGRDKIR